MIEMVIFLDTFDPKAKTNAEKAWVRYKEGGRGDGINQARGNAPAGTEDGGVVEYLHRFEAPRMIGQH